MNLKIRIVALLLIAGLILAVSSQTEAQVTTGTLIEDMVDLKKLAEYPMPYFNTIQYSSYDRRSTAPEEPGWFENSDGFGREPIPGFEKVLKEPGDDGIGEYLICDTKGPGAIVRVWTAAINGTIKLYLDNEEDPIFDGSAQDFFTITYKALLKGKDIDLGNSFTQNMAGYYPIPFAENCKIIWTGDLNALHFYHVNIRLYEKGTKVKTFKVGDISKYLKEIETTHRILVDPDQYLNESKGKSTTIAGRINSGEEKEILKIKGSKGIKLFKLKVHDQDLQTALRQNILRISFDGASDPQIQSPIGDFFGTASGLDKYQSLPFTVTKDGELFCRYYMPFKDSVSIVIENLGDNPSSITGTVTTEDYSWEESQSMYFKAKWRIGNDLKSSYEQPSDISYLQTSGRGVFVGTAAFLMNPSNVPSTYGNWWGEGDEKIFVDNNPSPVFFGTGSEDYFNYAWSSPNIFYHAYCGQPRNDGPGTKGFVTNYRWHIIDNIPFKSQFAFFMELLSHEPVTGFSYGRIAYHYGFKGMHDDNDRISKGDVRKLELPEIWYPVGKKGSAYSTFYQAEDLVKISSDMNFVDGHLWAGGKLLEWNPEKKGDQIILELPIPEDRDYVIHITARLDANSGTIKAQLNNKAFGQRSNQINLETGHGTLSRTFSSEKVSLSGGSNKLVLESVDGKPIGIDFIWIQKR